MNWKCNNCKTIHSKNPNKCKNCSHTVFSPTSEESDEKLNNSLNDKNTKILFYILILLIFIFILLFLNL